MASILGLLIPLPTLDLFVQQTELRETQKETHWGKTGVAITQIKRASSDISRGSWTLELRLSLAFPECPTQKDLQKERTQVSCSFLFRVEASGASEVTEVEAEVLDPGTPQSENP